MTVSQIFASRRRYSMTHWTSVFRGDGGCGSVVRIAEKSQ